MCARSLFLFGVILFLNIQSCFSGSCKNCKCWCATGSGGQQTHRGQCQFTRDGVACYRWTSGRWGRRYRTRGHRVCRTVCCGGYGGPNCDIPICGAGASSTSCNMNEGNVTHKNGTIVTNSGGTCTAPMLCTNCNHGYYYPGQNGFCRACRQMQNCNIKNCTKLSNTVCDWCVGELMREQSGYNVYTGLPDNKQCQRACSWREGYRCFPGTCTGDMIFSKDCKCARGFGGSNCASANADKLPDILQQILTLEGDGYVKKFIMDIPTENGKFWTNEAQWETISIKVSSTYKPEIDPLRKPSYITGYKIGIDEMDTKALLERNGDSATWSFITECYFEERCAETFTRSIEGIPWNDILQGGFPTPFVHLDTITFSFETINGGYVTYTDREARKNTSYYIDGISKTVTLELGFDMYPPEHCYEIQNISTCPEAPLIANDFIKERNISVSWSDWKDTDSGIHQISFNVYLLEVKDKNDPRLEHKYMLPESVINYTQLMNSAVLQLNEAGPYSVEMIVHDLAGNSKATRRIIMFDDMSKVELQGSPIKVAEANDQFWINEYSETFELIWDSRFINKRHLTLGWLSEVKDNPSVSSDLDDTNEQSDRTISAIHNINGITRIDMAYLVELNNQSSLKDYESVTREVFDKQKMSLSEEFVDGKRISYFVRGIDCMEEYAEDNVTVMIDLSPPVIQNLWLTKGNILNISVHSILELEGLTFEWEVYDEHSGIHEVSWRLFDNYTKIDVVHGKSHESPQGRTETLKECEQIYGLYARGPNCYCSPYNGCYHQHYQVKPQITNTGNDGLHFGKEIGVHDFDYFVEVTVINNARLTTVKHYKITIDVSPPQEGTVYDGIQNQPEVDFQQSLELSAHWDGFFDKESSVWFYMYGFETRCLDAQDLDTHSMTNISVFKTYETTAAFTAPKDGKYYITVMAYNHALDPSKPVCSDGVTIDSEPAVVSEIVLTGAKTASGLVRDKSTGELFVLYKNRELEMIENPSVECLNKATNITTDTLQLIPQRRSQNKTKLRAQLDQTCNNLAGVHAQLLSFMTYLAYLEVSWNVSSGAGGIHDFEVGIATEKTVVPDLMDFRSSHHHRHIRIYHPDIFKGEIFYLLIKAVTKSSVADLKVAGPFAVDSTKPYFQGKIDVSLEVFKNDTFIVAQWDAGAFSDQSDSNPLTYEVSIGSTANGNPVLPYQSISTGVTCASSKPPTCTVIEVNALPWYLHGGQQYVITIKATNTAGLFIKASSAKFSLNVEKASVGVVHDVDISSTLKFVDIDDIDYQTSTDNLSARWSGFTHPHEHIQFYVCLTNNTNGSYLMCKNATGMDSFTFTGLHLNPYQTYYQVVVAETKAGNVSAVSDGITIVIENDLIRGIEVFDGRICINATNGDMNVSVSHHREDKRLKCVQDTDYQSSQNILRAYWIIPDEKKHYLRDLYWAIEEKAPVADIWSLQRPFERLRTFSSHLERSDLHLSPGRSYRVQLKFCANKFCFQPVKSNGVTIIPNPPETGKILVIYDDSKPSIEVHFEPFKDTDVEYLHHARDVIDHYEWAFAESLPTENLITKWERASTVKSQLKDELIFKAPLDRNIVFNKCWLVVVRGYTKAGLSNVVSAEIRNCSDINNVRPAVIIDAVGDIESLENMHSGRPVYLDENDIWTKPDEDFTPFSNILSAVWPTLRYNTYVWAVLEVDEKDPTIFYENAVDLTLKDPCSHPDSIKCSNTESEYVNVIFNTGELVHGHRYIVCVHANATTLEHEFWNQELEELSACSDGITVDLTPPTPAEVWIGYEKGYLFQTSTSELTVNWNSFIDVEEDGYVAHASGISGYEVAIDTTAKGVDEIQFTSVGLTNHKTYHGLHLQSGHTYFATVKATDFTGQSSLSTSLGLKVDTSPPEVTPKIVTITSRHISDLSYVEACWTAVFVDGESGISHYHWAVGSNVAYDDIMLFTETREDCARTPEDVPLSLQEGHSYFVNVKAYNKAGLYKLASSWAFVVDASPPVAGMVCDGPSTKDRVCSDIDYSGSISTLRAHWTPFWDPHTTVKEYFITVGSCNTCDDVLSKQSVGIRTEMELTMLQLAQGIHYYVTITACNTADLCTSSSSDGFIVDLTPPIKGVVMDGTVATDIQFQASRNYIGCKWYGFNDPQSGVSHYVWRVGTTKGGDDILSAVDAHKVEEAFIFDVESEIGFVLPLGTRLYSTVRAYNKAGMFVESSSNGFIVDDTSPKFLSALALSPIGTIVKGTTILRSTLRVEWEVEDEDSFIENQYLSLSSHVGGDFNLTSLKVEGIVRDYTFTDLDLHDGSYYDINIISCNCAKLCTKSILQEILVDSTQPTPGTFAINTDHAANLNRQPDMWMTWTSISISLAWLGFEDAHTGIESYMVSIGSQYMGSDLNEIVNNPTVVNHSSNSSYLEDGMVQTFTFSTQPLSKHRTVYISITAKNKVGLFSEIVHSQFSLIYGGILELVRRCDSHSCLGHCVCAPHGQLCTHQTSCNNISDIAIEVKDYLDLTFPDNYPTLLHSPVKTMLAAEWRVLNENIDSPKWYEWSVGESSYDEPLGIFEASTERVWHDAGQTTQEIFTLKRGMELEEHTTYSFFVRAWFDETTFAVFKSPGVTIYSTAPSVTSIRGRAVKEIIKSGTRDVDFITRQTLLNADWKGKFINSDDSLSRFHLYISTYPGGHDTQTLSKNIAPTVSSFNLTGMPFEENTKYFINIQAYNLAELHTTEVSDGFMLDIQSPAAGIIHDGFVMTDVHAINSTDILHSFWHGFSDVESGITNYEYCVSIEMGQCDVEPVHDVGIATRKKYTAGKPFEQGEILRGGVRARDAAGHVSELVFSNGAVVDVTPPIRVKTDQCESNIISDFSFENFAKTNDTFCKNVSDFEWDIAEGTCVHAIRSSTGQDGETHVQMQGSISQSLSTEKYGRYRLTFFTSAIPSDGLVLSAHEGYVEVNNEKYIYLMYNRSGTNSYVWQKHTFFYHLKTNNKNIRIGTVKRGDAFAIDSIEFQLCAFLETEPVESNSHINAHSVFVHDWSSIHADWTFVDEESEIVEYLWAIGTVRGGTQLQEFNSVGRRTFANTHSLRLEHNSNVYVTVVAINVAGLRTVSYSPPVMIDLTPPIFRYIHDGPNADIDIDYQKNMEVATHWNVYDPESSIEECHWALGTSKGDTSFQAFLKVARESQNGTRVFSTIPDSSIFSTVYCTNGAGLKTTAYSDGVKILQDPPTINDVILDLMTSSATQFPPRDSYHGNNSEIKFRWTGFRRDEGINSYVVSLDGNNVSSSEIVPSTAFGYMYSSFTGLNLKDGEYTIAITAINAVKLYSQRKTAKFYLLTEKPQLTGKAIKTLWQTDLLKATASWENAFLSDHPMFYEVTVRLAEGGEGDLVQWQETTNTRIEITLAADKMSESGVNVLFSVRAISYSGLFTTAHAELLAIP